MVRAKRNPVTGRYVKRHRKVGTKQRKGHKRKSKLKTENVELKAMGL
jgi:hypothetical protein